MFSSTYLIMDKRQIKMKYMCPTCEQTFDNKRALGYHLRRKSGCKSQEQVFNHILVGMIDHIGSLVEKYELQCHGQSDLSASSLINRYERLRNIKKKFEEIDTFCSNHFDSVYDTDEKKDAVKKLIDDLNERYQLLRKLYVEDKKRFVDQEI